MINPLAEWGIRQFIDKPGSVVYNHLSETERRRSVQAAVTKGTPSRRLIPQTLWRCIG